jgi:drug/metabolite transporter (DMT)-like permease
MFFIGAVGVTAVSLLYFIAIGQIDSSLAIVLWYAYPVLVLTHRMGVREETSISKTIVIPLILTLTGIAISAGQVKGGNTTAIILVVSSSMIFAVYITVLSKVTQKMGLLTGASILNMGTATGYIVVGLFLHQRICPRIPHNWKSLVTHCRSSRYWNNVAVLVLTCCAAAHSNWHVFSDHHA